MSLWWMMGRKHANYQLHNRKTWPFEITYGLCYGLVDAIKMALDQKVRYVSKDAKLIWENPFWKEGVSK